MPEETCVLCNSKLDSKKALQEHFRKHANKEIDDKGLPIPTKPSEVLGGEQLAGMGFGPVSKGVLTGKKQSSFSLISSATMPKETCVLCNTKLDSKKALQEHFRKHANKEIDDKGLPIPTKPSEVLGGEQLAGMGFGPVRKGVLTGNKQSRASIKAPNVKSVKRPKKAEVLDTSNKTVEYPLKCGVATSLTYSKPPSILCDVCGGAFPSVGLAMSHKRLAHPEQPCNFCCAHCGKQFPLKTILESHTIIEHAAAATAAVAGEPQEIFKCQKCSFEFYNEEAKKYHEKGAHNRLEAMLRPVATPPPSKKIRVTNDGVIQSVYYCHLCGTEFISKFNLRQHLELQHSKEETNFGSITEIIRCTTCDAIFSNKKAYEAHNMFHQPNDLYVSSEEHRLKTVSRVDQDFDLRRVQIQMPRTVRGYMKQMKKNKNIVWNTQFSGPISSTKQPSPSPIESKTEKVIKSTESKESTTKGKTKPKFLKAAKESIAKGRTKPKVSEAAVIRKTQQKIVEAAESQDSSTKSKTNSKTVQMSRSSPRNNNAQSNLSNDGGSADLSKPSTRSSRSGAGRLGTAAISRNVDSETSQSKLGACSIALRVKSRDDRFSCKRQGTEHCQYDSPAKKMCSSRKKKTC